MHIGLNTCFFPSDKQPVNLKLQYSKKYQKFKTYFSV